jgi:hypothetical protein
LVHALDIARAIACTLEAPRKIVHNEIFNVGDSSQNYRVRDIAETVATVFEGCSLSFGESGSDNRSYRVNFDKINNVLPGFRCEWSAEAGAKQLLNVFSQIDLTQQTFEFRGFTRLKQLEYLIRTKQIDRDFFWSKENVFEHTAMPVQWQAA